MHLISALAGLFKRSDNGSTPPPTTVALGHGSLAADPEDSSLTRILDTILRQEGFDAALSNNSVVLSSGIRLRCELLEAVSFSDDRFRTSTRITAFHETHFPAGLPEFQHSIGATAEHSIAAGFSAWAKMDLITLQDSIRKTPRDCTVMEIEIPPEIDAPSKRRQIILGPVGHLASHSLPAGEEHPFCPCCLMTQSFDAFGELLESRYFVGLRLFASRDADGKLAADCRVNGEEFPEGVAHLIKYAQSWPERGFEFRKQYVVIRSVEKEDYAL